MAYPIEILPAPGYKLIDCDISAHFLLRIVYLKEDQNATDPETGKILLDCICSPSQRIIDFSCSLLGIYQPVHISIDLTEEGKHKYNYYCVPNAVVDPPQEEVDYTNGGNRTFWCVAINQLHDKTFEYQKGEELFTTTCQVVHTPMLWNFWHFSLRWLIGDEIVSEIGQQVNKKVAQRIGHSVRVILSQSLTEGLPAAYPIIDTGCFSEN